MKKLFFVAAIATLANGCVYKGAKITEGTNLILGMDVPTTEGAFQFDLLNFTTGFRLGEATPDLLAKLPSSVSPETFQSKPLTVDQTWLDRKRADGTDHRSHFFPHETNPNNIPLTVSDLELIPSIWREPDSVQAGSTKRKRIVLERSSLDGGRYKMVVDVENKPYLVTFYKNFAVLRPRPPTPSRGGQLYRKRQEGSRTTRRPSRRIQRTARSDGKSAACSRRNVRPASGPRMKSVVESPSAHVAEVERTVTDATSFDTARPVRPSLMCLPR